MILFLTLCAYTINKYHNFHSIAGMSGEMMHQCSCDLIRNCSKANIAATGECLESWQAIIDECLVKNTASIREAAAVALRELAATYYTNNKRIEQNNELLRKYINGSKEESWEYVRMGYVSAIGALPTFILKSNLNDIFQILIINSLTPLDRKDVLNADDLKGIVDSVNETNWSEARRDSVRALSNVMKTIGFDGTNEWFSDSMFLDKVFKCLLTAMQEYTVDNRGDIGAWVREAAMNALFKLIIACPNELLKMEVVHAVTAGLVQQAVEKIDRTRALAGKLFCKLIYR